MNKQFLAIIAVVIAVMVGIFALAGKKTDQSGSNDNTGTPSSHIVGAGKKNVTLVEYGDLQCPACKQYYPLVKQVREFYGDDLKFQFRHFPLNQIHPNAFLASRAAEAAGNQGKFFEMHDLMYENQDSWTQSKNVSSIFESFAQQLGLNMDQYKADVKSEKTSGVINADIKEGQAAGANSTPTFVLNGKKIEKNPTTLEEFKQLIDQASQQAN